MKVECCNCNAILEFAGDYRDNRFTCSECGAKNASMDIKFEPTIKFECYNCSKILIVDSELAEKETSCSACGMRILVPKATRIVRKYLKQMPKKATKEIDGALIIPFVGAVLMVILAAVVFCFGVRHIFLNGEISHIVLAVYLPYLLSKVLNLVCFNKHFKATPFLMFFGYFADIAMIIFNAKMALKTHQLTNGVIIILSFLVLWKIFWSGYFVFSKRVRDTFGIFSNNKKLS